MGNKDPTESNILVACGHIAPAITRGSKPSDLSSVKKHEAFSRVKIQDTVWGAKDS